MADTENIGGRSAYQDVSPKIVWSLRIVGICTCLLCLLALIFSVVQGIKVNQAFVLLTCNIVVSALVGLVNVWWYWKGALSSDKYWYMFLLAAVIMFQSIATDVYVFNLPNVYSNATTSLPPDITTASVPIPVIG